MLLFPSVLGARQGVTDRADALTAAGHTVTVVDPYEGQTFEDYPSGMARTKEIGEEAIRASALEVAKGVEAPFVGVGFSVGAATAQWVAAHCPETARAVVMVGGGMPMKYLEASWPAGVAGQIHVTAGDPFHQEDLEFDATVDEQVQDDVEHAGGEFAHVEYQGEGHLFSDPSFGEYQPEEARIFTRRVVELIDSVA